MQTVTECGNVTDWSRQVQTATTEIVADRCRQLPAVTACYRPLQKSLPTVTDRYKPLQTVTQIVADRYRQLRLSKQSFHEKQSKAKQKADQAVKKLAKDGPKKAMTTVVGGAEPPSLLLTVKTKNEQEMPSFADCKAPPLLMPGYLVESQIGYIQIRIQL